MLLCIIEDENQIEKSKFIRGNTMKKFGKVLFKILKWIFIMVLVNKYVGIASQHY